MVLEILLGMLTVIFILATILPFVRSDFWTFRILEYPRLQKLIIGLTIFAFIIGAKQFTGQWFWWMMIPMVGCIIYLIVKVFPYTIFGPKEMKRIAKSLPEAELKIFTANVLQENNDYSKLLQQIKDMDPDIIFLVETDNDWRNETEILNKNYPYSLKHPLDNTYGLLFYSRLKVTESSVKFLVKKEVPSIEATILLPGGVPVKLYGLHPKPPVPEESLHSSAKDKELMKVALAIEHLKDPCVVMGDLNDVAWSHVTELFRKVSGLLDPRRGRGFYSTFNANHRWMRFPLDYIFCSSHFVLRNMKRMPHNGSDHFAMFIHLQYNPSLSSNQEKPHADKEEKEDAVEKATGPAKD